LQNQQAPLQTDKVSHEVLLNLYSNEDKPSEISPLDICVVSYLILRKAFDHEIYDSQSTLAMRLGTDYKAVKRSLARLDTLGWITYRGEGIGKPKGISLNLEKLPAAQPIREKITPDATQLVNFYIELKRAIATKQIKILRLPRNWHQRQLPSAQRLLTIYGDYDTASKVVHALCYHEDPGIQVKSRSSLHNLLNTIPRARRLQEQSRSRKALEEAAKTTEAAFNR